ncbi:MAG: GAF domain-containing protein [Anaerolineae bacterium]|jgi:GAF domain-containing protein|nr:GAF domain-containing protein [Anaerolineae bacterium]
MFNHQTEQQRLAILKALSILDQPTEERFERITRLAQRMFQMPITMLSLVDRDRLWLVAQEGLPSRELPRRGSFCTHAIQMETPLIVDDAFLDDRFKQSALVLGAPYIRFYAGVPLHGIDGTRIGALCIIDHQPRHLEPDELRMLNDLAAIAQDELNMFLMFEMQRALADENASLYEQLYANRERF